VIIIWGLRVFFHTTGTGVFHCQRCGGDREYQQRAGRRFFTLFWIPIIPLNKVGDHVRCNTCRTRYQVGVLNVPTAAQMQVALPAGMRAAACVMLHAGWPPSEPARRFAIDAIGKAGAQGYGPAALDADLAQPVQAAAAHISQVGSQIAVPAREWFLAAVVRIGMADGLLTDSERDAAYSIGAALGMSQAQTMGTVALTEQSATSG
jgi:hypothetical protein